MQLKVNPYYQTKLGAAYLGDSLKLMAELPDESVDLICTSPPFALVRKKEYGNVDAGASHICKNILFPIPHSPFPIPKKR